MELERIKHTRLKPVKPGTRRFRRERSLAWKASLRAVASSSGNAILSEMGLDWARHSKFSFHKASVLSHVITVFHVNSDLAWSHGTTEMGRQVE